MRRGEVLVPSSSSEVSPVAAALPTSPPAQKMTAVLSSGRRVLVSVAVDMVALTPEVIDERPAATVRE
jgi:hypothetical protein